MFLSLLSSQPHLSPDFFLRALGFLCLSSPAALGFICCRLFISTAGMFTIVILSVLLLPYLSRSAKRLWDFSRFPACSSSVPSRRKNPAAQPPFGGIYSPARRVLRCPHAATPPWGCSCHAPVPIPMVALGLQPCRDFLLGLRPALPSAAVAELALGRAPFLLLQLGPALSLSLCSCSPCRESLASSPARLHFLRSCSSSTVARSSPLCR